MKALKVLLKTDIYGEPVSIRHVNLLHQKTTADDVLSCWSDSNLRCSGKK